MRRNTIRAYWWCGDPRGWVSNFGDAMVPLLLKRFAGLRSTWAPVSGAKVIASGSVLEHVPPLWDGHILGAGRLFDNSQLHLYTQTAKIWALRGPLTASRIPGNYAIGDPGLLADELVGSQHREFDFGVLPHWSDKWLGSREWYAANDFRTRAHSIAIDPTADPVQVITSIGKCKKIITSSLHGLIVADSFGIPRRTEFAGFKDVGGMFKFRDYSASIKAPFGKLESGEYYEASRFRIDDIKSELDDAFRAMGDEIRK